MKMLPNLLSAARGLGALLMLIPGLPVGGLWGLYIFCGVSDMLDGALARRFGWESETGAKIDSIADLLFAGSALLKILPLLTLPGWIWPVCAAVAGLRLFGMSRRLIRRKKPVFFHTKLNKLTGLLLFLLPLTDFFGFFALAAVPVSLVALTAAIEDMILSW